MGNNALIGITIGQHEILEKIGQGGMSEVYKARHTALRRVEAIKFLGGALEVDEELTQRFLREAQAIASMKRHANIIQVYDFGVSEGGHYIVMEYVEGHDLRKEMDRRHKVGRAFTPAEILTIIQQVASALDWAHHHDIVHRDVKPGNILINSEGEAILSDFGLAMLQDRISQMTLGKTFGTPEYIAPEQAMDSRAAGPASDIYALGGIVYEMLTGRLPFEAESAISLALKHVSEDPVPPRTYNPAIPEAVEAAILKALAKDPQQRYPTAMAFVAALREAWQGDVTETLRVGTGPLPTPPPPTFLTPAPATKDSEPPSDRPLLRRPTPPPPTPAPEPEPAGKKRRWPLFLLLGVALIATAAVLAATGVIALPFGAAPEPTATPTAAPTAAETEVAPPPATDTPAPTATLTPEPSATPEPTATPTREPTPEPSATPEPTPTATPTLAPGATYTREADGMAMHFVPEGPFTMGAPEDDPEARNDERPQREVALDAFWMDETEVTIDQYKQCVAAGACEEPFTRTAYDNPARGQHPMTYISWEQAAAYCRWVGEESGWDAQLPTEAQWEKAASWDPFAGAKRIYPWGDEFEEGRANIRGATSPVGSLPAGASAYGIFDLAGNVWEWVADWYDKDAYAGQGAVENPTGPAAGTYRVFRGGAYDSWGNNREQLRATYREVGKPESTATSPDDRPAKGPNLGFRCVVNEGRLP